MNQSKDKCSNRLLLNFKWFLLLPIGVLVVFFVMALVLVNSSSENSVKLGFKICELLVEAIVVGLVGGILVQVYIQWHSRESSKNEFRKTVVEAVICEYNEAKKARRLFRASCLQEEIQKNKKNPWTEVPTAAYDLHMVTINNAQLGLELVKRRIQFFPSVFKFSDALSSEAKKMEEYLGKIIGEYESERNRIPNRESIPLSELDHLRRFISKESENSFDLLVNAFDKFISHLKDEGTRAVL